MTSRHWSAILGAPLPMFHLQGWPEPYIYGVYTVFLAGESPNIRSYTVYIYGFGQPYTFARFWVVSSLRAVHPHKPATAGRVQIKYTLCTLCPNLNCILSQGRPPPQACTCKTKEWISLALMCSLVFAFVSLSISWFEWGMHVSGLRWTSTFHQPANVKCGTLVLGQKSALIFLGDISDRRSWASLTHNLGTEKLKCKISW